MGTLGCQTLLRQRFKPLHHGQRLPAIEKRAREQAFRDVDPSARRNRHAYEVTSPLCRYSMEIENAAARGNVKTSMATVYSVLREINRLRKSVVV